MTASLCDGRWRTTPAYAGIRQQESPPISGAVRNATTLIPERPSCIALISKKFVEDETCRDACLNYSREIRLKAFRDCLFSGLFAISVDRKLLVIYYPVWL